MAFIKNWLFRYPLIFGGSGLLVGLIIGFGLGVYFLPILIAEDGLSEAQIAQIETSAERSAILRRDLEGSDAFHWGEGTIYVNETQIWLDGRISPGPDYRLYLTPKFIETGVEFFEIKEQSVEIAPIKAFENFSVPVPEGINPADYSAVVIWCERFGQFITAAEFK